MSDAWIGSRVWRLCLFDASSEARVVSTGAYFGYKQAEQQWKELAFYASASTGAYLSFN